MQFLDGAGGVDEWEGSGGVAAVRAWPATAQLISGATAQLLALSSPSAEAPGVNQGALSLCVCRASWNFILT